MVLKCEGAPPALKTGTSEVNAAVIVPAERRAPVHCRRSFMHICKFSYLKGSIRVTLSWRQIKRSAVLKVNEYPDACEICGLHTSGKLLEKHILRRGGKKKSASLDALTLNVVCAT